MIIANDQSTGNEIIADPHILPASHINYTDGLVALAYLNSTKYISNAISLMNLNNLKINSYILTHLWFYVVQTEMPRHQSLR